MSFKRGWGCVEGFNIFKFIKWRHDWRHLWRLDMITHIIREVQKIDPKWLILFLKGSISFRIRGGKSYFIPSAIFWYLGSWNASIAKREFTYFDSRPKKLLCNFSWKITWFVVDFDFLWFLEYIYRKSKKYFTQFPRGFLKTEGRLCLCVCV